MNKEDNENKENIFTRAEVLRCRRAGALNRRPDETRRFRMERGNPGENHYRYICEQCRRAIAVPDEKHSDAFGGGAEVCSVCDKDYPYPPIDRRHSNPPIVRMIIPCWPRADGDKRVRFFALNGGRLQDEEIGFMEQQGRDSIEVRVLRDPGRAFFEWHKHKYDCFYTTTPGKGVFLGFHIKFGDEAVCLVRNVLQRFFEEEVWGKETK